MEKTQRLIGIDGGATRGRLLLSNGEGEILSFQKVGPLNFNNNSKHDIMRNLLHGINALLDEAEMTVENLTGIYAGVAGLKSDLDVKKFKKLIDETLQTKTVKVEVANDIDLLLAAGLMGESGIALILGTGSHCLGRDPKGNNETCGGWGYLMDDYASGYALGLAALRTAVRMWDGRIKKTPLADRVLDYLGVTRPEESLYRVLNADFDFADISGMASLVTELAATEDPAANHIVNQAVSDGVELVTTVCRKLNLKGPVKVVVTGGVGLQPLFHKRLVKKLHKSLPGSEVIQPSLPPVAGGIIRAKQHWGDTPDPAFLKTLENSLKQKNLYHL